MPAAKFPDIPEGHTAPLVGNIVNTYLVRRSKGRKSCPQILCADTVMGELHPGKGLVPVNRIHHQFKTLHVVLVP